MSQLALDTLTDFGFTRQSFAGLITTESLIVAVNKLAKHDVDRAIAKRPTEKALNKHQP